MLLKGLNHVAVITNDAISPERVLPRRSSTPRSCGTAPSSRRPRAPVSRSSRSATGPSSTSSRSRATPRPTARPRCSAAADSTTWPCRPASLDAFETIRRTAHGARRGRRLRDRLRADAQPLLPGPRRAGVRGVRGEPRCRPRHLQPAGDPGGTLRVKAGRATRSAEITMVIDPPKGGDRWCGGSPRGRGVSLIRPRDAAAWGRDDRPAESTACRLAGSGRIGPASRRSTSHESDHRAATVALAPSARRPRGRADRLAAMAPCGLDRPGPPDGGRGARRPRVDRRALSFSSSAGSTMGSWPPPPC